MVTLEASTKMTTIKHSMSPCEQCWILLGKRAGSDQGDVWWGKPHNHTEGLPACVDFDAKFVIEQDERNEPDRSVVGFLHTHPGMIAHYSSRDFRTMQAWVTCLGRPLVCVIAGHDGLRAWWFINDEDPPIEDEVYQVDGVLFGIMPYTESESKELVVTINDHAI